MDRLENNSSREIATPTLTNVLAVLAAVAMFFSTLEYLIPKPVPFFRVSLMAVRFCRSSR
jgi:heptaprenyl diphosphate synthase